MRTLLTGLLLTACLAFSADTPPHTSYSENVVEQVSFDPQGTWALVGVAGISRYPTLGKTRRRRLLGSCISIQGSRVDFWSKKVMSWKEPFPTPLLSQETYDTHSREFWLDFATDPQQLKLPRYVSAANVELGTLLATQTGRVLFEYGGVWFIVEKSAGANSHKL